MVVTNPTFVSVGGVGLVRGGAWILDWMYLYPSVALADDKVKSEHAGCCIQQPASGVLLTKAWEDHGIRVSVVETCLGPITKSIRQLVFTCLVYPHG